MNFSRQQTRSLVQFVSDTMPDDLDCDGCMERLPEYAESELSELPLPQLLHCVQIHISQCPCCADEHRALVEGLRLIECN